MNKHFFIPTFALLVLSFVLVQCSKENTNEVTDYQIKFRSQIPMNQVALQSECGPEQYSDDLACGLSAPDTFIIQTDLGCNVRVIMDIAMCHSTVGGEIYFSFTNLRWQFVFPMSKNCYLFMMDLWNNSIGEINDDYDEFVSMLADKFQYEFMSNWVRQENINCDNNYNYATSLYFKAICTQRCASPPSSKNDPFVIFDTPCATDGCCVDVGFYCVMPDGSISTTYGTETISPCTDFFIVDCRELRPIGQCKDKGCSE